ncbi:hypothetical protein DFH08DRAFT_800450 [Mycena albidolilacea]|uniref:Uncharacterized protein n=1 Tax=Mycena albidolilacea TaxID=1033008 RepID=A0AAD7AK23_9AGAR|nr:hypothetical protein DFH08DRAFT_800450 [Mycena albidolilacea]
MPPGPAGFPFNLEIAVGAILEISVADEQRHLGTFMWKGLIWNLSRRFNLSCRGCQKLEHKNTAREFRETEWVFGVMNLIPGHSRNAGAHQVTTDTCMLCPLVQELEVEGGREVSSARPAMITRIHDFFVGVPARVHEEEEDGWYPGGLVLTKKSPKEKRKEKRGLGGQAPRIGRRRNERLASQKKKWGRRTARECIDPRRSSGRGVCPGATKT